MMTPCRTIRNSPRPRSARCHYAHRVRRDVAVLSVSGWMDGAGYQNGAIARFLTLPNRNKHLLLGPWDHGARINVSPWRRAETPEFSLDGELLRFFDTYLMERETGLSREAPVHYFTMHGENWREAPEWPPTPNTRRLFLAEGGALSLAPGSGEDRSRPISASAAGRTPGMGGWRRTTRVSITTIGSRAKRRCLASAPSRSTLTSNSLGTRC